jgi:hypothetical protein
MPTGPKVNSVPFEQRVTCRVSDATNYSGIGESKIWEDMKANKIEYKQVGRCRLIVVKSFLKYLGMAA